ncbi:hypothetical protein CIW66_22215 [Enterobacter cloacae]|nr:hypothetical protein CIW67_21820 [Enterobacter cloacae]PAN80381.1 hypothetical protein CIW66_22215 [Enterobacter cloacae]PAN92823.1 hypothetical protein CIW63_21865 [Enterobacter cloacae]PAO10989.1 hypothetical protein CIW57_22370 [Enterobacter cloacae]
MQRYKKGFLRPISQAKKFFVLKVQQVTCHEMVSRTDIEQMMNKNRLLLLLLYPGLLSEKFTDQVPLRF